MQKFKLFYFLGIKGVGMAPLAIIAREAKFMVYGSDVKMSFITQNSLTGIEIFEGFHEENIDRILQLADEDSILMIVTAAHNGLENREAVYAKSKGIKTISQGQALGMFMDGEILGKAEQKGVSICGSHGKTTTTALLATVLTYAGFDPSYVVGTGEIFPLGNPGHFGLGEYFVSEADEYLSDVKHDRTPKFLFQKPKYIIANNIDFDHPDMYKDVNAIKSVFKDFFEQSNAKIIANHDDYALMEVLSTVNQRVITYGKSEDSDFWLSNYKQSEEGSELLVVSQGKKESYRTRLFGEFNALNALAVVAFCKELGLDENKIKSGLLQFLGSKRRLENRGVMKNGTLLFDDYAHHPNEIKATLFALKARYPKKTLTCVFQPHTFTRTISLLNEFADSFSECDKLLLLPVFSSARENIPDKDISSMLYEAVKARNRPVIFMENQDSVVKYVEDNPQDLLLTMGAGDVYKILGKLNNL